MSADEYLALPDDGYKYELMDGVVVMSPSPIRRHQRILVWLVTDLSNHVDAHKLGEVLPEIDVRFKPNLVYRPELVFVKTGRLAEDVEIIEIPPDLVVEILSPSSRKSDLQTKKGDYERAGVHEYWVIDTEAAAIHFFRLCEGIYQIIEPAGDRFESVAVPGYVLDLVSFRAACPRR